MVFEMTPDDVARRERQLDEWWAKQHWLVKERIQSLVWQVQNTRPPEAAAQEAE